MSRATPGPIARHLRQESGFGCCVCGNPIIQYHHIVEWSQEQHFRAEDMMTLCPLHHDQATKGAMPEYEQRQHKENPFNIRRGFTKGLLEIRQQYCAAQFGSVTVVGEGPFLQIDGEDILSFTLGENNLNISLRLFGVSDELILEIVNNEWIAGDPGPWDIEADWQKLKIRERAKHISLSINARTVPLEIRGEIWRAGKSIRFSDDGIFFDGSPIKGSSIQELALVGMALELTDGQVAIKPSAPSSTGALISWPNRRERLWKAKDAWLKMKKERNQSK